MALISIQKGAIFVHIYKTGGISLRDAIGGFECCDAHCPAWHVKEYLERTGETHIWDNSFKFAVVRDPYDWVISTYYHIHNQHNHIVNFAAQGTLNDYVHDLKEKWFRRVGFAGYQFLDTQTSWVFQDGKMLLDVVLRFEQMEHEYARLKARLKLDADLPRLNVSQTRPKKPFYELLMPESIAIINELYSDDFENFGYKKLNP